jgi:hypothetical protein
MIDIDRRYGPWSARVWGLILNLAANALALYGLAGYLRNGTRLPHLVIGLVVTAACIFTLARPSK